MAILKLERVYSYVEVNTFFKFQKGTDNMMTYSSSVRFGWDSVQTARQKVNEALTPHIPRAVDALYAASNTRIAAEPNSARAQAEAGQAILQLYLNTASQY